MKHRLWLFVLIMLVFVSQIAAENVIRQEETRLVSISAGERNTCALKSDGSLTCWGASSTPYNAPTGTFTQIAVGVNNICGIQTDGTLKCAGDNTFNQITNVPAGKFAQVDVAINHACGLKVDGTVTCWGANNNGESNSPAGTFTQISTGAFHNCGVKSDGSAFCWGTNADNRSTPPAGIYTEVSASDNGAHSCGLLSDGTATCWGYNASGQATAPAGVSFTGVSVGGAHSCGIKADSSVTCWGWNGNGESSAQTGPFLLLSAGTYHTCGIKTNGTTTCWGNNAYGQSTAPGALMGQQAVSGGGNHTCRIKTDGTVTCWGRGNEGQTTVPANLGTVKQISGGRYHHCAIKTDNTLQCWGYNANGETNAPAGQFKLVSAGSFHNCAIALNNTLSCWGYNNAGQATAPAGTFTQVSIGRFSTCALRTNGIPYCWGENGSGQNTVPQGTFSEISSGYFHNCGIRTDGTVTCWGYNVDGQLTVPAGTYTQISAGAYHTCGIKSDNTLACWGWNDDGQNNAPSGTFTQVSSGAYQSCAVSTAGSIDCWGQNVHGAAAPLAWLSPSSTSATENNGTITLNVYLNAPAYEPVTISLDFTGTAVESTDYTLSASGLQIPEGGTSASLTITALDNAIDEPNKTVIIDINTVTGADEWGTQQTTLTLSDDDTAGVILSKLDATLPEDGSAGESYTIALTSQPLSDVTVKISPPADLSIDYLDLVFTDADWNVPQPLNVTMAIPDDSIDENDEVLAVKHSAASADPLYDNITISDLNVTVRDDDTAGIVVLPGSGAINEDGLEDAYQIMLNSEPTDGVKVFVKGPDDVLITPQGFEFSALDWNIPQKVTVAAVDDLIDEDDEQINLEHGSESGDPFYNGLTGDSYALTVGDNDSAGITISKNAAAVAEGGAGDTYTVVLNTQPGADVVVTLNLPADVGAVQPVLTFNDGNWNIEQTVQVYAVDDFMDENDELVDVTYTVTSGDNFYNGFALNTLAVTVSDNDTSAVQISKNAAAVAEGGAGDTYTVVLMSQPADTVTVNLALPAEVLSGQTVLNFDSGNWNTPQTVTLSAFNDDLDEDAEQGSISHSITSFDTLYAALLLPGVDVTITDDDTAGVQLSKLAAAVSESGATDSYTVALTSQPEADVTVTLAAASDVVPDQTLLTFTPANWNTAQTVQLGAAADPDAEGTELVSITHTPGSTDPKYAAVVISNVEVTVSDDDLAVTELLLNPGFDLHTIKPSQPDNWQAITPSKDKLNCSATPKAVIRSLPCAYRFTGGLNEQSHLAQMTTTNLGGLTQGVNLNVSVYYRTSNVKPRVRVAVAVFFTGNPTPIRLIRWIKTASPAGFTKFEFPAYEIPGGTVQKVSIRFSNRATSGVIYLDDASINYGVMLPRNVDAIPLPPAN